MKQLALILYIFTAFLVSTSNAQQTWERTYGGTGRDNGSSVRQTTDGGYIVTGMTESFGNYGQVYLFKTDSSGDTLWTRNFGGPGWEAGNTVQQTQDGGYVVVGYTDVYSGDSSQIYLIKTNASGDTLWSKTSGGGGLENGNSVQQTSDTGYIITGHTSSFGNGDQVYLIKTNASGDTLWTRTYGGLGLEGGFSVQQTTDGGYIVSGHTNSCGNGEQVYLIKTNASGDTLWSRNFGGPGWETGYTVQQTQDTGYIVVGASDAFGNGDQIYLIKTNPSGDTLWSKNYGGTGTEHGRSVQQTQDGGYIITGNTNSFGPGYVNVYLIKTNASGDTLWTRTYGGTWFNGASSVQQTADGGYIISGFFETSGHDRQAYLIKTDTYGNVGVETPVRQLDGSPVKQLKANPNPFTSFASVPGHEAKRFGLYDVSGRLVGTYRGDRVGEGLGPGVYFLRSSDGKDKPLRVVKVR